VSTPRPKGDLLVSVVVPTWEEAAGIGPTLDHLAALPGAWEIVVVDGGSPDGTARIAAAHPSRPRVRVREGGGRAAQCNDGLEVARGEVVLLLHADSRLPVDAHAQISGALGTDPTCPGGNFTVRFDGVDRLSAFLTRFHAWQRRRGFYYGDSSVWLTRAALLRLGGLREIAIMDDYDLVRRLERLPGTTACLPGPALTSSRRWRQDGVPRTLFAWAVIRWLYVAGVAPDRLARLYRAVR
jgi:rSAM/selenodomain-associated transferase 2